MPKIWKLLENAPETMSYENMRYKFANCVLDTDSHTVLRDGEPVNVEPQVFDLLHLLVKNAGKLVTRDTIIKEIWNDRIVSESTISARTNAARTVVGDSGREQSIIKTVVRRGLKLVVAVSTVGNPVVSSSVDNAKHQKVRYAKSRDGTKIAFASIGSGPSIIRVGHFLTHLEMDWNSQVWRPYLDALSLEHTLIRYDQRGTGLSDPEPIKVDLKSLVSDLESVADAVGLKRFPLIALSQGVPVAIQFAVLFPERVSCIVLYGGYSQGSALREGGQSKDTSEAMLTMMKEGWGKPDSAFMGAFTSLFCPDASQEKIVDLVQMQLASASPENALRLRKAIDHFDVLDQLTKVSVPTLVIHSRNDSVHPISEGKKVASNIPNANLVVLESNNHILLPDESAWSEFIREALSFVNLHQ